MTDPATWLVRREQMVREQLAARDIRDQRVLEAMGHVPREVFVSKSLEGLAYADEPLPIGFEQTISQPLVVATTMSVGCVTLALYLLPRIKGAMIGFQWAKRMHGFAHA